MMLLKAQSLNAKFRILAIGLLCCISFVHASFPYYGTKIGSLKRLHHGVSGDVYAVDSRTLFIKKFNYDGEAPAAYFYVGNTNKISDEGGIRLRDERGSTASLTRRYRNKDITLLLPEGKTLRDFKWFSVWCDEFSINFGDVTIPAQLDYPKPQKIAGLKGVHGVSSDSVVIVDAQTLLVPNFSYDGDAPDAKFWVGRGQRPTASGLRIPDENGKENPLRRYDRKTIVLTLPDDLTIFDIGHFGVWCEAFTVDFGHVRVPEGLNVPPSLKMLGISPQSKLNCEVLYDDLAFEVRWAVAGESIVVQLVAKLDDNEYMSFGVSPSKQRSEMIGADVVVAWVDKDSGKGYAEDYFMDDKSQCSGGRGVCPERETNSIRLLNAAMVNGYSIVTYQRSLQATDKFDLPITTNQTEAVVWAIGPLNERKEASFHAFYPKRSHFIDFGRAPTWNCPMPEGSKASEDNDDNDSDTDGDDIDAEKDKKQLAQAQEPQRNTKVDGYPPAKKPYQPKDDVEEEFYDNRAQALQHSSGNNSNRRQETNALQRPRPVPTPKPVSGTQAWDIPAIQCHEPEDGVFYAQMGPTGGKHGYSAITGHVGWGISWFINGLLIPEIHVVRGKTYTFVVEGGNNPDIPAKYHPFYITDDPIGGYEHKREEEKKAVRIFAGVHRSRSGQVTPTGVGRLCHWTPDIEGPPADDYQSFGAYQRTLTLKCDDGEPGVITWKPDRNTPDTVYYHCFTHRYLGWKIHVHDSCEDGSRFAAASEKHELRLPAIAEDDEEVASSIRHETKVSPNDYFLMKHQKDLIKNHNMNGTPPKLTFEITKSSEITKLISDGIRAAEALEESIIRNAQNNQKTQNSQRPGVQFTDKQQQQQQQLKTNSQHQLGHQQHYQYHSEEADQRVPPKLYISTAAPEILHGETQIHAHPKKPSQSHAISHDNAYQSHAHSHINSHNHHSHPNSPHLNLPANYASPKQHLKRHPPLLPLPSSPSSSSLSSTSSRNNTNLPQTAQKTIGLSEYLRPPQNAPVFNPVKLPGRRPHPAPIKKVSNSKPILPQHMPRHPPAQGGQTANQQLPQPSVIVNHYRKPGGVPSLLKPFFQEKTPFPIQPIAASVLLLGQPTELNAHRKTQPILHPKHKPKPHIPVPYSDLEPQGAIHHNAYVYNSNLKKVEKKPQLPVKQATSPVTLPPLPPSTTAQIFKRPFDIHPVKEDSPNTIPLLPAVNNGFQPDSVVVESGFKPIRTENSIAPEGIEQVANRREDPGTEIDEAMETDTLFLTAQSATQTHNFEPMFIPSPPDSTNETIVIRKQPAPMFKLNSVGVRPLALTAAEEGEDEKKYEAMPKIEDLFARSDEEKDTMTKKQKLAEIEHKAQEEREEHMYEEEEDEDSEDIYAQHKTQPQLNLKNIKNYKLENKEQRTDAEDIESDLSDEFEDIFNTDSIEQSSAETAMELKQIQQEGEHKYDKELPVTPMIEDDKEAQAAERIDTYYLPPDNRKVPNANVPSGAVITYDGKSVIDSSLVLPPKLDAHDVNDRLREQQNFGLSKTEQLVRSTPQFQPFRGEIPAAISELLTTENSLKYTVNPVTEYLNPITSTSQQQSIFNTPTQQYLPPSSSTATASSLRPISTKLQLLKKNTNS